jgi:hypothetical protein
MVWGRWVLLLIAALSMLNFIRRALQPDNRLAIAGITAGITLTLAISGWWLGTQVRLQDSASRVLVAGLLTNVYRAFDFREESDIYDVLERSVEGELLREVYLEMRRGLILASQGGASARVKDVELTDLQTLASARGCGPLGPYPRKTQRVSGQSSAATHRRCLETGERGNSG